MIKKYCDDEKILEMKNRNDNDNDNDNEQYTK